MTTYLPNPPLTNPVSRLVLFDQRISFRFVVAFILLNLFVMMCNYGLSSLFTSSYLVGTLAKMLNVKNWYD